MTDVMAGSFVAAERCGWPNTATCHLQRNDEENALCGYEWEGLRRVPGDPGWTDLHPDLRCDACSRAVGVVDEGPRGQGYRHSW